MMASFTAPAVTPPHRGKQPVALLAPNKLKNNSKYILFFFKSKYIFNVCELDCEIILFLVTRMGVFNPSSQFSLTFMVFLAVH